MCCSLAPPRQGNTSCAQVSIIFVILCIILVASATCCNAFVPSSPRQSTRTTASYDTSLQMGIFDSLKEAFSNDAGLSPDKAEGQLEGPGIDSDFRSEADLTDVQRKWLASQQASKQGAASKGGDPSLGAMDGASGASPTLAGGGKGAPLTVEKLIDTEWILSLYLCGIPDRDPSNNLYGSKTNISTRNKNPRNAGLPLGATLPEQPSAEIKIKLLEDGIVEVQEGDFTTGKPSSWLLSPNGRTVRISLDCNGFVRTVTTKGTIQKVFWSDGENEVTTKTSSEYSIPPGLVYAEIGVGYGKPGELLMLGLPTPGVVGSGGEAGGLGVITVERSMGLLGATSKMEVCGKLTGRMATMIDAEQ